MTVVNMAREQQVLVLHIIMTQPAIEIRGAAADYTSHAVTGTPSAVLPAIQLHGLMLLQLMPNSYSYNQLAGTNGSVINVGLLTDRKELEDIYGQDETNSDDSILEDGTDGNINIFIQVEVM